MKRICILILIVVWAMSIFAATPGDSLGVKQVNGNSCIIYKMASGETIFAVSRKYNIPFQSIVAANPGVDMNSIKSGQQIFVPSKAIVNSNPAVSVTSVSNSNTGIHLVAKGETMYSIARNYAISLSDLAKENPQLQDYTIKEGQKINLPLAHLSAPKITQSNALELPKVTITQSSEIENSKNLPTKQNETISSADKESIDLTKQNPLAPVADNTFSTTPIDKNKSFAQLYAEYNYMNLIALNEKGVATWIDGSTGYKTDSERFYALHNSAPIGSIMKVRNLMNNRTIYAKVIGTLSESEVNDKVLIKLSAGAAQKLNVLDNRFVVEATHYEAKQETSSK